MQKDVEIKELDQDDLFEPEGLDDKIELFVKDDQLE